MKNTARPTDVTRESVLTLLSEDEIARVSNAETTAQLSEGDEYLDLEQLAHGVRRAGSAATPTGRVLPRNAVHSSTWSAILTHLAASR